MIICLCLHFIGRTAYLCGGDILRHAIPRKLGSTMNEDVLMTDDVSTIDILSLAKAGDRSIRAARQELYEAKKHLATEEKKLQNELRQMLVGKTVTVTGHTETVEILYQDGYGHGSHRALLSRDRMVVKQVFLMEDRGSASTKSPLVYAAHEEAHLKQQQGGEVAFRLLELSQIEVVESS